MEANCVILGIDPGTVVLGYGLVQVVKGSPSLLEMGVLRLERCGDHPERLQKIFSTLEQIILRHKPGIMALEAPFFGKNVQSMLKLGRAQGVAMAAGMMHRLEVAEYSPRTIKQKVTGKGGATKEAVRAMLETTLQFRTDEQTPLDATDALAVALCHYYTSRSPVAALAAKSGGGASVSSRRRNKTASWEQFLRNNPDRIG